MRRILVALLVLGVILAHEGWSSHIPLDWPMIALIGIFLGIVGAPELSKMLPLIKRVKVGEAEIELQESIEKLHQEVEKAEEGKGAQVALRYGQKNVEAMKEERGTENAILELAAQDKESAVVRLTIEIEKELADLYEKNGLGTETPKTIRDLVNQLVARELLSQETAKAILEFRDVRNRVIHPRQAGTVPPSALGSAIDSGIRILRILRSSGR